MLSLFANKLLLFVAVSLPLSAFSFQSELDNTIEVALETFQVPGLAIGIISDGQVVLAKGYGQRNIQETLPVDEKTLFAIGSCTKAFTALLLGQLVDEGKIEWDDPVARHLPQFKLITPYLTKHVTIRDILSHRTGIERQDEIWVNPLFTKSKVLDFIRNLKPEYVFREKFLYNNLLYATAGILTESIYQKPWEAIVEAKVFSPLGMSSSNVSLEKTKNSANFSLPYKTLSNKIEQIPFRDISSITAAGAICSNIADMLLWINLQLSDGGGLVKKETLKEMHFIQTPMQTPFDQEVYSLGYGLGWGIGIYRGHYSLFHQGKIDGFTARITLIPDKKMGVIVLTNSSSGGPLATLSYYSDGP